MLEDKKQHKVELINPVEAIASKRTNVVEAIWSLPKGWRRCLHRSKIGQKALTLEKDFFFELMSFAMIDFSTSEKESCTLEAAGRKQRMVLHGTNLRVWLSVTGTLMKQMTVASWISFDWVTYLWDYTKLKSLLYRISSSNSANLILFLKNQTNLKVCRETAKF